MSSLKLLVENKLKNALSPTVLNLIDNSGGCGAAFDATIVSHLFENKKLIDRHRLVNSILEEELKTIHAFTMKCHTPEEWSNKN